MGSWVWKINNGDRGSNLEIIMDIKVLWMFVIVVTSAAVERVSMFSSRIKEIGRAHV